MIYVDIETYLVPKDNGKQNLKQANIENILLAVITINLCLLMVDLVHLQSYLSHI